MSTLRLTAPPTEQVLYFCLECRRAIRLKGELKWRRPGMKVAEDTVNRARRDNKIKVVRTTCNRCRL